MHNYPFFLDKKEWQKQRLDKILKYVALSYYLGEIIETYSIFCDICANLFSPEKGSYYSFCLETIFASFLHMMVLICLDFNYQFLKSQFVVLRVALNSDVKKSYIDIRIIGTFPLIRCKSRQTHFLATPHNHASLVHGV